MGVSARAPHLLDLPVEIQQHIVSNCCHDDLICFARVSKRCHELASAILYRSFDIIFPDADDDAYDSPHDGLASGLDTFTTSGCNYAQWLREISLDTLSAGSTAEHAYGSYLCSAGCGQFLNTLLCLTLKRAKSLEAFQWNIRVELSPSVYRELHQMKALRRLHIRLQAGPSFYSPSTGLSGALFSSQDPNVDAAGPHRPSARQGEPVDETRTLGGFRNLQSLAVLDVDSLDVLDELRTCIKNSASLTSLSLSFSDDLAAQARRPSSPGPGPDVDSEGEEEPTSPNSSLEEPGLKEVEAQEEEALGIILGLEHKSTVQPRLRLSEEPAADRLEADTELRQNTLDDSGEFSATSVTEASRRLLTLTRGSSSRTAPQDVLDTMETVEGQADAPEGNCGQGGKDVKAGSTLDNTSWGSRSTDGGDDGGDGGDADDDGDDGGNDYDDDNDNDNDDEEECTPLAHGKMASCQTQTSCATRGLPLESFSVCLIPTKASVLHRAIDLHCLKELTLLDVGNQVPIWTMLARVNQSRPLPLRSVFTDHASLAFLQCLAQLDRVHELLMLKRAVEHLPESSQPPTATTMHQIRRLVLKKHMPVLKRLMIKDEAGTADWDVDEKAMILICRRGAALEEVALGMDINAVHAFMQFFSGLTSLRAVNVLRFRNSDTCIWAMRELLRFTVDSLSHYPQLPLEWIALGDDTVYRVVRSDLHERPDDSAGRLDKGKGLACSGTLSTESVAPELDSSSESDDDNRENGEGLLCRAAGPVPFYDVLSVKMFEKEIRSGRL